jgi:hypothetical protein
MVLDQTADTRRMLFASIRKQLFLVLECTTESLKLIDSVRLTAELFAASFRPALTTIIE